MGTPSFTRLWQFGKIKAHEAPKVIVELTRLIHWAVEGNHDLTVEATTYPYGALMLGEGYVDDEEVVGEL